MSRLRRKEHYSLLSFLSYLGQHKGRVGLVFGTFIVSNTFLAVIPVFVGRLIGSLTPGSLDSHQAYMYVAILAGCSMGHDLLWRLSEFLYMKLLNPLSFQYESLVFRRIIHKPYPYFVDKFTGKISSYTNTLGQEFREFMEHVFWEYAGHIVNLVGVTIILTAVNWQTGLVFALGIILMFFTGQYTIRNSTKYEKGWTDIQSTKNGKIFDAIANFVSVKSFQKERLEAQTIEQEQAKTIKAANTSFAWNMVFWGSMSLYIRYIIWPATIVLNVYLFLQGRISIADLTTFLTAVTLFTGYIWDIIWSISQFSLRLARIEEAHTYLFGPTNIVRHDHTRGLNAANQPGFLQQLRLSNLSFAYPDKPADHVLKDIDLIVGKGEKIGIVGRSGSGKTTLTKLLLDYYPLEAGSILLDKEPISPRNLSTLISYVPQDTSLFHRTIAENIEYATDRDVNRNDIIRAAKQAHADEFIRQITNGYDAMVGERGVKLSAGQRQRIAIARAFLDDKPLLILDEATSALDSESEILIQQALEALWQHKTVIAIAHRLSTLRHMDRILVIEQGRIIEQGSHHDLLNQNGHYAKLWSHQSGGFLDE